MRYEYCNNCKSECEYIEVKKFIEYINDKFNTCYHLTECPDQTKKSYTCDLAFKDDEKESTLYVEVKRVKFGFGSVDKSNTFLGSQNGQLNCAQVISQTINDLDDSEKIEFLDDFMVDVPLAQLNEKEIPEFRKQLISFLEELEIDEECNELWYIYKRNSKEIKISFKRKDEGIREKFGDETMYSYETGNENSLYSIGKKMTDIESLKKLICKNFYETSIKKYPKGEKQKILLNILELPLGYDLFFNLNISYVIDELLKLQVEEEVETAATEGYLLYFCNEFFTLNEENELGKQLENALIIIPLIAGMVSDVVFYYEDIVDNNETTQ